MNDIVQINSIQGKNKVGYFHFVAYDKKLEFQFKDIPSIIKCN